MTRSNTFETIDPTTLSSIHGGDAWDHYKDRIKNDFKDGMNQARLAQHYNVRHGHFDPLKLADHAIGMGVAAAKTNYDLNAGGLTTGVLGLK